MDPSLRPLIDRVVPLTEYAWALRYPGDAVVPEDVEARAALALTRELVEALAQRLPAEARPERGSG